HDPQPQDLYRNLHQEVAAKRKLAVERVAAQVGKHPEISAEPPEHRLTLHRRCSASVRCGKVCGKAARRRWSTRAPRADARQGSIPRPCEEKPPLESRPCTGKAGP